MSEAATTKLSSKGQVVIPEEIRNRLGLKTGAQFVVLGEGDVVILKAIHPPSMEEFDEIVSRARKSARRAGLKKSDVGKAVKDARAGK
jgi:AbrB family looped-hinge helix DNA binding protein